MTAKIYLARESIDKVCKALVNKTNEIAVGVGYSCYMENSETEDRPELVQIEINKGVLSAWFGTWCSEPTFGPEWDTDKNVKVLKDLASNDIHAVFNGLTIIFAPYGHRLCKEEKEGE